MQGKIVTERGEATFHSIYVREPYGAWCNLLWNDRGRVILLSDYGCWSYPWTHRGDKSVPEFLLELEREYTGKKFLGNDVYEQDHDATVTAIREQIVMERKDRDITADTAADEWLLAQNYADGEIDFSEWGNTTQLQDQWECRRRMICSDWTNLWERLWVPLLVPELSKFIATQTPAKTVQ